MNWDFLSFAAPLYRAMKIRQQNRQTEIEREGGWRGSRDRGRTFRFTDRQR